MNKTKLQKLTIHNFKCIKDMEIAFNGNNAVISGMNASGKSTIADAYFWLLTGKNMAGDTKFAVTPLDSNGYELRDCITSVEAVITVNGNPITLRKEQYENISKKDREFLKPESVTNKTKSFYVDSSPISTEYAYNSFVSEKIASEDTLKYLTNLNFFVMQKPEKQREWLTRLVNTDTKAVQGYDDIKHLVVNLTPEQKLKGLQAELKAIEKRLEMLPNLIQENCKYIADRYADYDRQLLAKQEELKTIQKQIGNLMQNTTFADFSKKIKAKEIELDKLIKDNAEQDLLETNGLLSMEREVANITLKQCKTAIEKKQMEVIDTFCPTCKRPYESAEMQLKTFNEQKAKFITEQTEEIASEKKTIEDLSKQIEINDKKAKEIIAKQNSKIEIVKDEIKTIEYDKDNFYDTMSKELYEKKTVLTTEIERLEKNLEVQQNINKLTQEQRTMTAKRGGTSHDIDLLKEFIKQGNLSLETAVNGLFETITFKLFEMQANGEYKQICEPCINGVKYSDVNTASKINAGLEIIDVFSDRFEIRLPIFIDNAECVNQIYQPKDTQLIKLYVNENKLRIMEEI